MYKKKGIFFKYYKILKWEKIKKVFRKKSLKNKKIQGNINKKNYINKELKNRNSLSDFIKDNEFIISLLMPFIVFLIDALFSLNTAIQYNIPTKFVGIDMKAFVVFFIIFSSPFIYSYFFKDRLEKIFLSLVMTFLEIIILITIILNRQDILYEIYVFFERKIWKIIILFIIITIIILLMNSITIFLLKINDKWKIFYQLVKIIFYIILLIILFKVRAEWSQIVTLKNSETKIVIGYSDGEYLVVDYEIEKTLRGYEKLKYTIPYFDVQKSELKKFDDVIFFGLQKEKEVEILILNNGNSKVAKEYYDYKYKAYDYTIEENLKIYKKPVYKISSADISEIELKKFKEINLFELAKIKEIQIITLNDGKQKVLLSEPSGEYGVFDFKEEDGKLTIYKIPSYEIIISEIKSVAPPKEFKEVEYKNFMLAR